jgi:2Fe-2S ferredoxin
LVGAGPVAYDRAVDVRVHFRPSGRTLRLGAGTTLLAAARRAGLPVASACGAEGICGRCGMLVLEGATSLSAESDRERSVKRRNRIDPGLRLACRTETWGDVVVTASHW